MGVKVEKCERGQMTVELAVVFPVLLIIAVIATNALLFISECASFDQLARDAVRVHATAPAYGQTTMQSCALIQQTLSESTDREWLNVSVESAPVAIDCTKFTATLEFTPTLFGMGMRSEVLGVSLPHLTHRVSIVVDPYKPGVVV